ncbi:MAG TPA: bifunctional nuclease family protein [Bacillota bacterium]
MKRVELAILGISPATGSHVMVLREADGERALVMGIGPAESLALATGAGKAKLPRPLTHDLIKELLDRLEVKVRSVVIHDVRDNAFIASLEIDSPKGVMEIDCRPSDAVALALRCEAPILADERMLEEAGVDIGTLRHQGDPGEQGPEWID